MIFSKKELMFFEKCLGQNPYIDKSASHSIG